MFLLSVKRWRRNLYSNSINECKVWRGYGATGFVSQHKSEYHVEYSARAGGVYYVIDDYAAMSCEILNDIVRARLTTLVITRRLQGQTPVTLNDALIDEARSADQLPIEERVGRLLLYLTQVSKTLGTQVILVTESHEAYAWTESLDWAEVQSLLRHCATLDWLRSKYPVGPEFKGEVTVAGWLEAHRWQERYEGQTPTCSEGQQDG